MSAYGEAIPVNVVTGFLGSGKTTLLARLLAAPALTDTAVLVNELGEVGLDHDLLSHVAESTLLLENGCLCCAIRGDLQGALRDLFTRRERGEVPPFRRVVIETSGLADPVPIAFTILTEPVIQHHFRLGCVITTVDAVNAAGQQATYPQWSKQVAVADRLVLTKTSLAAAAATARLKEDLGRLNRAAPILDADADLLDPAMLLSDDIHVADARAREAARWLDGGTESPAEGARHGHGESIASFSLVHDGPLDWTALGIWMTMLLHRHGEKVLRIKGLVNVAGEASPVLINGVQHIVHPPMHLEAWPDENRASRIVFITDGLSEARLRASLAAFNALAEPAPALVS